MGTGCIVQAQTILSWVGVFIVDAWVVLGCLTTLAAAWFVLAVVLSRRTDRCRVASNGME